MTYQPPKVTIDLAEYNELIDFKKNINKEETQMVAKKIIHLLFKNGGNLQSAISELNMDGIFITIRAGRTSFDENDITFQIKK